jgi:tripartite-type tricarboxylate transporter receptor subunit TctC
MAPIRTLAGLSAGAILVASGALAQAYPDRSITMVVPFAAGGPTDTVARLFAEAMSGELGQQVLVENVGGAGGTLGAGQVAEAEPDGYTILMHHIGMATAPSLYRNLAFDPVADFAPVGLVTAVPMTVVARGDFEPADAASFVQYVKDNVDITTMANAGIGAASHLCGLLLMQALEAPLVTVPYRGTGPAMTELVGGQIDIMCDQTTNTTSQIQGGTIKAYMVTSPERLDVLPDVPTVAEAGLPGIEVSIWHGIYAPAGTPQEALDALEAALQAALADPEIAERLAELGTAPSPVEDGTPEALAQTLQSEIDRWRPVIEEAGVYAD